MKAGISIAISLLLVGFVAVAVVYNSGSRFYSNMSYEELGDYKAKFGVDGPNLLIEIVNVSGLNIYEFDHRVSEQSLVLSAHRVSSGGAGRRTDSIPIPNGVNEFLWLNPDSTTTVLSLTTQ